MAYGNTSHSNLISSYVSHFEIGLELSQLLPPVGGLAFGASVYGLAASGKGYHDAELE